MKYISLSFVIALCGCGGWFGVIEPSAEGENIGLSANTTMSPRFDISKPYRIAVLPFINSGKEGVDYSVSDKISTEFMKMNFIVVDRAQLEAIFSELKLNLTGAILPSKLKEIGKLLSIDILVVGTSQYVYIPSSGFANAYGASQMGATYALRGETVRMIDVESGEVLVSSYCCPPNFDGSLSNEIADSIRAKIASIKRLNSASAK